VDEYNHWTGLKRNYKVALSDLDALNIWIPPPSNPALGHWLHQSCWDPIETFSSLTNQM